MFHFDSVLVGAAIGAGSRRPPFLSALAVRPVDYQPGQSWSACSIPVTGEPTTLDVGYCVARVAQQPREPHTSDRDWPSCANSAVREERDHLIRCDTELLRVFDLSAVRGARAFVPVIVDAAGPCAEVPTAPGRLSGSSTAIVIGAATIRVPCGIDPATLTTVLAGRVGGDVIAGLTSCSKQQHGNASVARG